MGKIEKILKKGPVEGQTTEVYPVTSTKAVYDENNKRLDNIITGLQESIYLNNTPIDISFDDTPESNAQNVKNIADYIEKAKAAGVDTTSPFKVFLLLDGHPTEGIYDTYYLCIYSLQITDDGFAYIYTLDGETGKIWQHHEIVTENSEQKVTSSMLDEGARRPIILTPGTTEVDEETYQKLLSDNVDVMFKTSTESANLCTLTYKVDEGGYLSLYFTCFSLEESTADGSYLYAFEVEITKTSPHTCSITQKFEGTFMDFINGAGYINKFTIRPVLQEINLSGTDADRKAKLDQFAVNWKALTGSNDLNGARFVGNVSMNDGALTSVLLSYDIDGNYSGISMSDDVDVFHLKKIVVHPNNGSVESIPLFSHLEAVFLRSGSDSAVLNANKAAIEAYIDNIINLGIDPDSGYIIPIQFIDRKQDYYGVLFYRNDTSYLNGIVSTESGNSYCNFTIDRSDGSAEVDLMERLIIEADLFPIKTQLKYIETCMKFTEISSSNKLELDKYLVSVPNATVMHCTYKDVYAGTLYKINSDWYGLLVKNTNNPADNINIKLSADGTIVVNSSTQ